MPRQQVSCSRQSGFSLSPGELRRQELFWGEASSRKGSSSASIRWILVVLMGETCVVMWGGYATPPP